MEVYASKFSHLLSSEKNGSLSLIYSHVPEGYMITLLTLIPAARGKNRAAFVKMRISREWLARKIWKNLYGSQIVLPNFLLQAFFLLNDVFFAKVVCFC